MGKSSNEDFKKVMSSVKDIIRLVCPLCRARLEGNKDYLICTECKMSYPIIDGIPSFVETDTFYEGKFASATLDNTTHLSRPVFLPLKLREILYEYFVLSTINLWRRRFVARMAKKYKGLTLDIGCGGGRIWTTNFGPVIGCDISLSSLKIASNIYSKVIHSTSSTSNI